MPKYFGTDGVRAVAGQFPLVEDFITKLGYCALKEIEKQSRTSSRDVIIAEDSRASGREIAGYLARGIRAAGYNAVHIGVAPTPAASFITQKHNAVCGIVISASHNPAEFNGIKFFSALGCKINEELEADIENAIEACASVPPEVPGTSFVYKKELIEDYVDFLKSTFPKDINLKGTKIVLDCANGASYQIAPRVFNELGADVTALNVNPDGFNINNGCGALHTQGMQEAAKENKAFMGFSFDGDADRLIASDELGRQLDGDNIIAAAALYLKSKNALKGGKAVLTIMANLGLINFLKANGIEPVLTKVGDKYVFEALDKENLSIGGETSGHVIFRDISRAGDGILCALQLLAIVKYSGRPASYVKDLWTKYPLKLVPVKVAEKTPLEQIDGFLPYVEELQKNMGAKGRIVVRYSGTEPLLRILVEGEDKTLVEETASKVADFYLSKIKAGV